MWNGQQLSMKTCYAPVRVAGTGFCKQPVDVDVHGNPIKVTIETLVYAMGKLGF